MAGNIRNARTTHPRKAVRRARAAERLSFKHSKRNDIEYMKRKAMEGLALGLKSMPGVFDIEPNGRDTFEDGTVSIRFE